MKKCNLSNKKIEKIAIPVLKKKYGLDINKLKRKANNQIKENKK